MLDLNKDIKAKHILCLLILVVLVVIKLFLVDYKKDLNLIYEPLKRQAEIIKSFSNDELNFIRTHSLKENGTIKYIKNNVLKFYGNIKNIKTLETKVIANKIKLTVMEINLLFWHDKFIFDLVDSIGSYNKALMRVSSLQIKKINNNLDKPGLKVKILCELYQLP